MSSLAWAIAASDLEIQVTAPYSTKDDRGGIIEFVAHVPDFGSSKGTLVLYMPSVIPKLNRVGYFVSVLRPELYAEYDRARFVGLLTAWGWNGRGIAPDWYEEP